MLLFQREAKLLEWIHPLKEVIKVPSNSNLSLQ